jgi:hypothetical protein
MLLLWSTASLTAEQTVESGHWPAVADCSHWVRRRNSWEKTTAKKPWFPAFKEGDTSKYFREKPDAGFLVCGFLLQVLNLIHS